MKAKLNRVEILHSNGHVSQYTAGVQNVTDISLEDHNVIIVSHKNGLATKYFSGVPYIAEGENDDWTGMMKV